MKYQAGYMAIVYEISKETVQFISIMIQFFRHGKEQQFEKEVRDWHLEIYIRKMRALLDKLEVLFRENNERMDKIS